MSFAAAERIHIGAVAPYSLKVSVADSTIDLSTTSAVYFRVWRYGVADSAHIEWQAQSVTADATSCTAEYTYQAGDLPAAETITVAMRMVTANGDVFAKPQQIRVEHLRALADCLET